MLNPPERVAENIRVAPERMSRVDEVLGERRLQQFAQGVSRILAHIEPSAATLNGVVRDKDIQAEIILQLISAATELETGWNTIRLANIPSAQRQGRVASELIATAVLMAIPLARIRGLPRKVPVARYLQEYPDKTVIDLQKPVPKEKDGVRITEPLLKATEFFASFLAVAETVLKIPKQKVDEIRAYRQQVQHPASHGSAVVPLYHFEAFRGGPVGAVFDKERTKSYCFEADQLTNLTHLFADVLDWTARWVSETED
jgi:hypothetical protein